jgi:polyisoprenoid-binding protein YceI
MKTLLRKFLLPVVIGGVALGIVACGPQNQETVQTAAVAAGLQAPTVEAGVYTVDASHSNVGFRVRHLGLAMVNGRFDDVEAIIEIPDGNLANLQARAVMKAGSINTNHQRRDDHLRSDDFFDAENHPEVTFESRQIEWLDESRFQLTGDLTMRGVTREVTLDGEFVGTTLDGQGNHRVGLSAETVINRHDFGLSWNRTLETGGIVVADDVRLAIEFSGVRKSTDSAD